MLKRYESWGRYPRVQHAFVTRLSWRSEPLDLGSWRQPVLPFAQGRTYGDTCLNDGGVLIDTEGLRRFIAFDATRGRLRCEAGTTLADILELIMKDVSTCLNQPERMSEWVRIAKEVVDDFS